MASSFKEALIEADIKMACCRIGLDASAKRQILANHRADQPSLLPYCVTSFAMLARDDDDPADRDRKSLEAGLRDYIEIIANPERRNAWPLPWPSYEWRATIVRSCDHLGYTIADRDYVLDAMDRDGARELTRWVELCAATASPEVGHAEASRRGCKSFAKATIWLRDHRPIALPLSIYATAG